jgi:hypothetical protein
VTPVLCPCGVDRVVRVRVSFLGAGVEVVTAAASGIRFPRLHSHPGGGAFDFVLGEPVGRCCLRSGGEAVVLPDLQAFVFRLRPCFSGELSDAVEELVKLVQKVPYWSGLSSRGGSPATTSKTTASPSTRRAFEAPFLKDFRLLAFSKLLGALMAAACLQCVLTAAAAVFPQGSNVFSSFFRGVCTGVFS